ncbi:MAG: deacetylase [Gammaproteobacteria bacterium]|nr:deacetylase [Gammaproteobacteria bacterium]
MYIYTHSEFVRHEVAEGHPERPERLRHLMDHLEREGILSDCPPREPTDLSDAQILAAHTPEHLQFLQRSAPTDGIVPLDPDTWMGARSLSAARLAASAVCSGVDDVLSGEETRVFCAVRPPGHHAEADSAMGFCLFNSIAIAALHALNQSTITRVAILDFDVHHGNGSVDICKDHPEIMVCSSFQHPYYPNRMNDIEQANIVNTPLPAGSDGDDFRRAITNSWLPALERHRPNLILVSAGFDAHQLDPLAALNLQEEDFKWITREIVGLANQYSEGRVVSTLEGGYDLDALARSAHAHITALM